MGPFRSSFRTPSLGANSLQHLIQNTQRKRSNCPVIREVGSRPRPGSVLAVRAVSPWPVTSLTAGIKWGNNMRLPAQSSPEGQDFMQAIYLEGDPGKHRERKGSEQGKEKNNTKLTDEWSFLMGQLGLSPTRGSPTGVSHRGEEVGLSVLPTRP